MTKDHDCLIWNRLLILTYIKWWLWNVARSPGAPQPKAVCVHPGILGGVAGVHGSPGATHAGVTMESLMLLLLLLKGIVGRVHAARVGHLY